MNEFLLLVSGIRFILSWICKINGHIYFSIQEFFTFIQHVNLHKHYWVLLFNLYHLQVVKKTYFTNCKTKDSNTYCSYTVLPKFLMKQIYSLQISFLAQHKVQLHGNLNWRPLTYTAKGNLNFFFFLSVDLSPFTIGDAVFSIHLSQTINYKLLM